MNGDRRSLIRGSRTVETDQLIFSTLCESKAFRFGCVELYRKVPLKSDSIAQYEFRDGPTQWQIPPGRHSSDYSPQHFLGVRKFYCFPEFPQQIIGPPKISREVSKLIEGFQTETDLSKVHSLYCLISLNDVYFLFSILTKHNYFILNFSINAVLTK
jgi:hypothetical protein